MAKLGLTEINALHLKIQKLLMSNADFISKLHPKVRDAATKAVNLSNQRLTGRSQVAITFGMRTIAEQNALYAQGRTSPGKIVTKAKGGQSYHNYGLAVDIALLIDGKRLSWDEKADWDNDKISDWTEVVGAFKECGWEWGGDWISFKDMPHFEMRFGHTWHDLLPLIQAGKVDKDGFVIL